MSETGCLLEELDGPFHNTRQIDLITEDGGECQYSDDVSYLKPEEPAAKKEVAPYPRGPNL